MPVRLPRQRLPECKCNLLRVQKVQLNQKNYSKISKKNKDKSEEVWSPGKRLSEADASAAAAAAVARMQMQFSQGGKDLAEPEKWSPTKRLSEADATAAAASAIARMHADSMGLRSFNDDSSKKVEPLILRQH